MTTQEAIESLKRRCVTFDGKVTIVKDFIEALDMAIEALEKQIPKKVIRERGECYTISRDGIEGYLIYFECPSCGNKLLHKNFPCKCGQKLDWGD